MPLLLKQASLCALFLCCCVTVTTVLSSTVAYLDSFSHFEDKDLGSGQSVEITFVIFSKHAAILAPFFHQGYISW